MTASTEKLYVAGRVRRRNVELVAERAARFLLGQTPIGATFAVCVDADHVVYVAPAAKAAPVDAVATYSSSGSFTEIAEHLCGKLQHHLKT